MTRRWILVLLLAACGDDGESSSLSGGGTSSSASASSATSATEDCAMVELPGCDDVVEVCEAGDCSCVCADPSTSTAMPDTTTAEPSTSSDGTSTASGETSAGPTSGDTTSSGSTGSAGPLGQCISVDVWESCAQYCEAEKDACQEAACDGGTVHYYDSGGECTQMRNGQVSDQSCDDPLQSSGGTSFARCCCG